MQGLNKIFIMGYLGGEPEMHTSQNGHKFTSISVATHRSVVTPDDVDEGARPQRTQKTDWHYIRVWGRQAETCAKFLQKGSGVMVEGYLSHYTKTNKHGEIEWKTGIHALRVDFLPRATDQDRAQTEAQA